MIPLTIADINAAFEGVTDQVDALVNLYRHVFPWDEIETIDRWPTVSHATNHAIFDKFIDLDSHNNAAQPPSRRVVPGGLWMNNGFSTDDDLPDWMVDTSKCVVHKKESGG